MLVALLVLGGAELFVVVKVAEAIGVLDTLALLVLVGVVGAALMRRVGLGVWRRAQARLASGEVPGREIVDGVLVLAGGALLAVPGFITDVLGLLLLIPPVRAVVRTIAIRRLRRRVATGASSVIIEGRAREIPARELEP